MSLLPSQRLNHVRNHLESLVTPDIVTRNYDELVRFEEPSQNIFAIISGGFPAFGSWSHEEDETHDFMILAQRWVADDTAGEVKEDIEFSLLKTIRELVMKDGSRSEPLNIELVKAHQSRQMDPNHAWVLVELRFNDL